LCLPRETPLLSIHAKRKSKKKERGEDKLKKEDEKKKHKDYFFS